jgi:mannose-1-phosphate guanylyltransferase
MTNAMINTLEAQSMASNHLWGVILAGGEGTRLQPLTRLISGDDRPKQFCTIFGEKSLLACTRVRVANTVTTDRTMFVVTKAHESFYANDLSDVQASRIVVQPSNKGTAAAVAYAALRIIDQDEDAVVALFPSDHYYADEKGFVLAVECATEMVAAHPNSLILLGAEPTHAEVEYGWIEPGAPAGLKYGERLRCVNRFWEKPGLGLAQTLQQSGCLWNTFVMVGRAKTFIELLGFTAPLLLHAFLAAWRNGDADSAYEFLPSVDFSQQVLSKCTGRLLVMRLGNVGWSDLGKPDRVIATLYGADAKPDRAAALRLTILLSVGRSEPAGSLVGAPRMRTGGFQSE